MCDLPHPHFHPHDHGHISGHGRDHGHHHDHDHGHHHDHGHGHGPDNGLTHDHSRDHSHSHNRFGDGHGHTRISLDQRVVSENDRQAADIRAALKARGLRALNLVSSPGSGKTSLLERTLATMGGRPRIGLIAGDVQTENDADRLSKAGGHDVHAIVTGGACHLDASMITRVLLRMNLDALDLLVIENVGNLVCPAAFDLGEDMKVVLISTTEGDDKPLKYPSMFRRASVMVINKIDLLAHTDFSIERVKANAHRINPDLRVFEVSCRTGDGLDDWMDWIRSLAREPAPV